MTVALDHAFGAGLVLGLTGLFVLVLVFVWLCSTTDRADRIDVGDFPLRSVDTVSSSPERAGAPSPARLPRAQGRFVALYDSPYPVPMQDTKTGALHHSPRCAFDPEGTAECDCGLSAARIDAACMTLEFENRG